jgi:hypothetical protein
MQAGPFQARCIDTVAENPLKWCLETTISPGSGMNSRTIWVFQAKSELTILECFDNSLPCLRAWINHIEVIDAWQFNTGYRVVGC